MKIDFVDAEPPERAFFEAEFPADDLRFPGSLEEVGPEAQIVSVFINSKIDAPFLESHPALKLVATRSTTCDHMDLAACARQNVTVCCVENYGDHTVAEHAFALTLALCRHLRQAMQAAGREKFSYAALRGVELNGKTFGAIGAGRIGRQTLRLAKAFGMETLACDIRPEPETAAEIGFAYVTFDELLRRSHVISLSVPLTSETFHLLDRAAFAKCRRGVILINAARGRLIDTDALIEALNAGIVGGAGLDVLEDERVMRKDASRILVDQIARRVHQTFAPAEPLAQNPERVKEVRQLLHNADLLAHPNVVFTPHIAFNSVEAIQRINLATVENIKAFLAGAPRNVVLAKTPELNSKK